MQKARESTNGWIAPQIQRRSTGPIRSISELSSSQITKVATDDIEVTRLEQKWISLLIGNQAGRKMIRPNTDRDYSERKQHTLQICALDCLGLKID